MVAARKTGSRARATAPGHNYLCAGLELFFAHTRPAMLAMAGLLQQDQVPSEVMTMVAAEDARGGP